MASALRFLPSVLRIILSLSPFQCGFEGSAFLTSFWGEKKKERERATKVTLFTALLLPFQCLFRHPTIIGVGGWCAAAAARLGAAGPHPALFMGHWGWEGRTRCSRGAPAAPWALTASPSAAGQRGCNPWDAQKAHPVCSQSLCPCSWNRDCTMISGHTHTSWAEIAFLTKLISSGGLDASGGKNTFYM